jgi:hypothetical protein
MTQWEHVRVSAQSHDVRLNRCSVLDCYGTRLLEAHEYALVVVPNWIEVFDTTTSDPSPAMAIPASTVTMFAITATRVRPGFKVRGGGFGVEGAAVGIAGAAVINAGIQGLANSLEKKTTITVESAMIGVALSYDDEHAMELYRRIGSVVQRLLPPATVFGPLDHFVGD